MEDLKPEGIQALASFHSTMAEQLNARLAESPRFFGLVILALTAYSWVIWYSGGRFMLSLVTVIVYFVVLWAILYFYWKYWATNEEKIREISLVH